MQLAIPADTEDACRAFWAGILGMTELAKPAELARRGGCWFRGGGLEVHLGVEAEFRAAAKAHPGILVEDIHSFAQHLEQNDVIVTWDDNFPGYHRFYASDPVGNPLEFLQPAT